MEADSLWKFNLSNYGRFRLSRYPKVTAPKVATIFVRIKSPKGKIQNRFVAKNLTRYVKKSEIHPSIAPDHHAIYFFQSWTSEISRGPGLWKLNNTLLNDTDYVTKIRETYPSVRAFYSDLVDKCLLWEILKMEMRATTILFSKKQSKVDKHKRIANQIAIRGT